MQVDPNFCCNSIPEPPRIPESVDIRGCLPPPLFCNLTPLHRHASGLGLAFKQPINLAFSGNQSINQQNLYTYIYMPGNS